MKKLIIVACLSLMAVAQVQAKDVSPEPTDAKPAKVLTSQQQKMKDCNAEAKTKALKGADRKTFMKGCLSADGAPAAAPAAATAPVVDKKASQQGKMKSCNADAKTKALKGDERKAFMKDCLSAK